MVTVVLSTLVEDTIRAPTVGQPPLPPTHPVPEYLHTAVWTGSEMIVWGGALNSMLLLIPAADIIPVQIVG